MIPQKDNLNEAYAVMPRFWYYVWQASTPWENLSMRFLSALGRKFLAHKRLWLYGFVVFLALAALAFTVGLRINQVYFSYWVYSPNLWAPYIIAAPDIVNDGTPVAFTFYLFSHFAPWQASGWLFAASLVYWAAISFVVVTLVAALFDGLNLRRKKLALWIDVAIVLLFIAYLAYADAYLILLPVMWRFAVPAMALSVLTLWALSITLGHRPPFLELGRRKRVVIATVAAAIICLSAVIYCDINSVNFTEQNVKMGTWVFVVATWLFMVIWLICEVSRRISFKLRALLPYLCAFGVIAALALTVGLQSPLVFGQAKELTIRVLWLPHFNVSELISLPADQFAPFYSNWGLDVFRTGYIQGLQYSYFSGWNILSFLFTLMWWAILSHIFVTLGRQFYAAVRKDREPTPDVLGEDLGPWKEELEIDDTANDVTN
jgi:hypothetical protein